MSCKKKIINFKPIPKDQVPESLETVVYSPKFKGSQFLIIFNFGGKRPERKMWFEGRTSREEINLLARIIKQVYNPRYSVWTFNDKYRYKINMQVREHPPYSVRELMYYSLMYAGLLGICVWALMLAWGVDMRSMGMTLPDWLFGEGVNVPGYWIPIIGIVASLIGAIRGGNQIRRAYNLFVHTPGSGSDELLFLFYILISVAGITMLIVNSCEINISGCPPKSLLDTTAGMLAIPGAGIAAILLFGGIASNLNMIDVMKDVFKMHDAAVKRNDRVIKKNIKMRIDTLPPGYDLGEDWINVFHLQ